MPWDTSTVHLLSTGLCDACAVLIFTEEQMAEGGGERERERKGIYMYERERDIKHCIWARSHSLLDVRDEKRGHDLYLPGNSHVVCEYRQNTHVIM